MIGMIGFGKKMLLAVVGILLLSFTDWQTDFAKARQVATDKHRIILLNFSGSDWCGPCMRMRKEIFDSPVFTQMADSLLVTVNADFPRNKKNQLPEKQRLLNEELADKYNPEGSFPFTVLLNAEGKVIKSWTGLPAVSAELFSKEIESICHAN